MTGSESDPNPVIDEGIPISTARRNSKARLCDLLRGQMELDDVGSVYRRGSGPDALGVARIICAWTLSVQYISGQPTLLKFDVINDNSPITILMDLKSMR